MRSTLSSQRRPRREWPSGAESIHASETEWFKVYLDGFLAEPTTDVESIAAVVYDEFVDHHLVQPKLHRRLQCHVYEVTKKDLVIANSV